MDIDKKPIAAVKALEELGYVYRGDEWFLPASAPTPVIAALGFHPMKPAACDETAACDNLGRWERRRKLQQSLNQK